jgi:hypothetical protein
MIFMEYCFFKLDTHAQIKLFMDFTEVSNEILDLKDEIEDAANKGLKCEDFLRDSLDKSPSEMPKHHLNLWKFAFENTHSWSKVLQKLNSQENFFDRDVRMEEQTVEKKEIHNERSSLKSLNSLELNNEINENDTILQLNESSEDAFQIIENALIVIDFYTKQVHGKKN